MRHLFSITSLLSILCFSMTINAQQTYRLTGYVGKDTLSLGIATVGKKGILQIPMDKYTGTVTLTPVNANYTSITQHLEAIGLINSEAKFEAAKAYIRDTLDFTILYHTPMWKEYVQHWVGFYAQTSKSPEEFASAFVPVAKTVLSRTVTTHAETASVLSKDLIDFFQQYGLDTAAENIAALLLGFDVEYGKNTETAHRLVKAQQLIGKTAPELIVGTDSISPSAWTGAKTAHNSTTILFFYESGCGNCMTQIEELKKAYEQLQSLETDIISIAADEDQHVFEYHSNTFPWHNKLCDLKGFNGENFKNYGVAATPTIYLIDNNGIIKGKYAKFEEIEKELTMKNQK